MARSKSSAGTPDAAKKQGRLSQMRAVFTMTRQADPGVVWWMLLAFVATVAVALLLGLLVGHPVYVTVLGVPLGVMAALIVMARRAERAAYARLAGQPGAASAALQNLRRGWSVEEQPVAADARNQDFVFRAVGSAGVVLVADGNPNRSRRLAENEQKRINRVLGANVPVTVVVCGDGEGEVPLRKLAGHVMRLRPQLTKGEVSEVAKRLRAMGAMRLPIPKGVDPTRIRPDRKAARGR